jgi:hypothetical protein
MASIEQKTEPTPLTTTPEVRHRYVSTEKRYKSEVKNKKKNSLYTPNALKQSEISQISHPKTKLTTQATTRYFH